MSKRNDGGPAFPLPSAPSSLKIWPEVESGDGEITRAIDIFFDDDNPGSQGMSLRDWFAGRALPFFLAEYFVEGKGTTDAARGAYQIADAMLAARESKP